MGRRVVEGVKGCVKGATSFGAAGGTAVGAVAMAGTPGLSAVGITTGLAALGGGAMVGGIAVVAAGGAAVGYGAYQLVSWLID